MGLLPDVCIQTKAPVPEIMGDGRGTFLHSWWHSSNWEQEQKVKNIMKGICAIKGEPEDWGFTASRGYSTGPMHNERIVWTKMRSPDWWEQRRGDWWAVLAILLDSAHLPVPPLMMAVTTVFNEYHIIATSCVNAIACLSHDSWHSLSTYPPIPCLAYM